MKTSDMRDAPKFDGTWVITSVGENKKREGTAGYRAFKLLQEYEGQTVQDYLAAHQAAAERGDVRKGTGRDELIWCYKRFMIELDQVEAEVEA